METKKFFGGMTPFYEFDKGETFVGFPTGKTKPVGTKEYPIFVSEDGEEFLMNDHKLIMDVHSQVNPETKVSIQFKGKVNLKGGKTFSNYLIYTFEDVKKEPETKKEEETIPEQSKEDTYRQEQVKKSGKNK